MIRGGSAVDTMHVEVQPPKIWRRYAKGWLAVDVIAGIPFNWFLEGAGDIGAPTCPSPLVHHGRSIYFLVSGN